MPRRHDLDPVSVRALTYLRTARGGYVPTASEITPAVAELTSVTGEFDSTAGRFGMATSQFGAAAAGPAVAPDSSGDRRVGRPGAVATRGRTPPDHGSPSWSGADRCSDPVADSGPMVASDDGAGRHRRHRAVARWAQLPSAFVGARWQPGRAAVLGVVLAALAVVAVLGLRVAWASTRSDDTISAPGYGPRAGATGVTTGAVPVGAPPSASAPSSGGSGGAPARPSAASTGGAAVVHVVGQVRRPGVYRLPHGSRVSDAVAAAEGATTKADLARVNLARVVVDGEQVKVPAPGEPVDPTSGAPPASSTSGGSIAPGATTRPPVSLNSGDLAALDTLPGVGPVLAQRILDWRTEHGRFTSVDELGEVSGIGEKVLGQLRPLVTL
ncbi:MAG: helix-hairpin-helix domain-containing protein [Phycicoccus sp.]